MIYRHTTGRARLSACLAEYVCMLAAQQSRPVIWIGAPISIVLHVHSVQFRMITCASAMLSLQAPAAASVANTAAHSKPITTSDVCRLANMGRTASINPAHAASVQPAPLHVQGPMMPQHGMMMSQHAEHGSGLYEDTEFLPSVAPGAAAGNAAPANTNGRGVGGGMGQMHMARGNAYGESIGKGGGGGGGALMYEDTDFVGPSGGASRAAHPGADASAMAAGVGAASNGFAVYEDTVFGMPAGHISMLAASMQPSQSFAHAALAHTGSSGSGAGSVPVVSRMHGCSSSGIYEDTVFVNAGAVCAAAQSHAQATQPMTHAPRPVTNGVSAMFSGSGGMAVSSAPAAGAGALEMYEDTHLLPCEGKGERTSTQCWMHRAERKGHCPPPLQFVCSASVSVGAVLIGTLQTFCSMLGIAAA